MGRTMNDTTIPGARRCFRLPAMLCAAAFLLTACGLLQKQQKAPISEAGPAATASAEMTGLRDLARRQRRLEKVTAPLLLANADLCRAHARNLLGFTAQNKYSFSSELADEASAALGLDEKLQVTNVMLNSGAARAGLRTGDRLLMADGKKIPQGPNAEHAAGAILGPLTKSRADIKLTVLRNNAELIVQVPLTRACGFRVALGNADNINSYADGQRVTLTRGMLDFVRSDEELAYVIAKDMAHNTLGHADKLRLSGTAGGIIDNLSNVHPDRALLTGSGGLKPMPQELDAAADRLALYMLVRAGFSIERAHQFWQRLADQVPATVLNGYTAQHPATAYRLAELDKSTAEIKAKLNAKKTLTP
jgi:hypothetical protein